MAIYNLPQDSGINFTDGADKVFVYIAREVPIFMPMMLFSLFLIIMLGGYMMQRRQEGRGDIALWFSIAGWITSGGALFLFLVPGMVNLTTVIVTLSVSFLGVLWFFSSKDNY